MENFIWLYAAIMVSLISSHWENIAGIAQSVVRRIGSAEVTGPIPVTSFFYYI